MEETKEQPPPPADAGPAETRTAAARPLFEPGDPRDSEAWSAEDAASAAAWVDAPGRWSLRSNADWMAVRLQYGRNLRVAELSRMFSISVGHIYARRDAEDWVRNLSEADRRELARIVWFAGVKRRRASTAKARKKLKASSEWERIAPPAAAGAWRPRDRHGEPQDATFHDTAFQGDTDDGRTRRDHAFDGLEQPWRSGACYTDDDPRYAARTSLRERLDAALAALADDAAEGGDDPGSAGVA
jgi:hypothetical protein